MLMQSATTEQIFAKHALICSTLEPITREALGNTGGRDYKYADYPAIMARLQPLLVEHQCTLFHYHFQEENDGNEYMVARLNDNESGEWIATQVPYAVQDVTNPQKHGSAMTYAKRYNTVNLFNIVTPDDDDGKAASEGGASNREFRGTGRGTDEHGVRKIKSKYAGKSCVMCNGRIEEGDEVAWKKGKPAVHWACYEQWKKDSEAENLDQSTNADDDLPFAEEEYQ